MYVTLPLLTIRRKVTFERILKILFWVGCGIAVFGLSSLFMVEQTGWLRVVPYSIFGFAPLGFNHNLVAEALTALIPISAYVAYMESDKECKQIYSVGVALMIFTVLLTLSRAGWLALMLQAGIFVYFL